MSVFARYNLNIVNSNLLCNEHLESENETEGALNLELNDQCNQLNAFELLSSMHNENKHEKLGTRYIDIAYDLAQNVGKTSNTCKLENSLKHYKTIEVNGGDKFQKFMISYYPRNKMRY